jgi:cell division protein FtsI/penicillin-binding protein 2
LVFKLVDIQIINSEELKYYAERQQTKIESVKAERGLIYDRNSLLLAYNSDDVSFYIDLRMLPEKKKKEVAEKFSSAFGKSEKHYLKIMNQSGKTVCLEKKVKRELAFNLLNYKLPALFYREDPTRVYQYGVIGAHVLGYVNHEYIGANGIEKAFEENLKGENGTRLVERNAIGDMITVAEEETKPAIPGDDLFLTIDKTYQGILTEELIKGLETYKGKSASGIIMDPKTGEILALANAQHFDPNFYWKYDDFQRKNRVITDTYEPGSTFKSISLAALLNEGTCKESDLVNVENGKYKFRNSYIYDTHKHKYLTVKGVMEESSNIGIAKLIQDLDAETYYKYLRDFGFGTFTSVSLPGEVKGNLRTPLNWSKLTRTYMSFGYGLSVTPLQLATAFCSIINGGILYEPQILEKQVDKNGEMIFSSSPVIVRRVISEETSKRMRNILAGVVENGTGKNAKVENISVGGKTGTAKVVENGKYITGKYNSSFIGFFPVENPKIVCLILVKEPELEKYGSKVAAPIFKNIAKRIVQTDPQNFEVDKKLPGRESLEKNNNENVEPVFVKNNNPSNEIKPIQVNYSNKINKNVMPDLRGRTVKDALVILNMIGLTYKINGSGVVTKQSIAPGTIIKTKKDCIVNCSELSVTGANVY